MNRQYTKRERELINCSYEINRFIIDCYYKYNLKGEELIPVLDDVETYIKWLKQMYAEIKS